MSAIAVPLHAPHILHHTHPLLPPTSLRRPSLPRPPPPLMIFTLLPPQYPLGPHRKWGISVPASRPTAGTCRGRCEGLGDVSSPILECTEKKRPRHPSPSPSLPRQNPRPASSRRELREKQPSSLLMPRYREGALKRYPPSQPPPDQPPTDPDTHTPLLR